MCRFTKQSLMVFLFAGSIASQVTAAPPEGTVRSDLPIHVVNPTTFPKGPLTADRTALGVANDYKPWIAQLSNGDLLIVASVLARWMVWMVTWNERSSGVPTTAVEPGGPAWSVTMSMVANSP